MRTVERALVLTFVMLCAGRQAVTAADAYVAPDGRPNGIGSKESPIDLRTAYADGERVKPGTTVWIAGGRYEVGELKPGNVNGTAEKPVTFRAAPGERATIVGEVNVANDHVWLWGLEITGPGNGVRISDGDGIKLINLILHDNAPLEKPAERKPTAQGIAGWDVGDDHEFYGNIIYHNGWNTLDHGIYSQNTARHTVKRVVDNIVFENAGYGLHLYGSAPVLSGFHVEGNICFATSLMPRSPAQGQNNILIGGAKPLSNVVLRSNCTYHPQVDSKRGVDIGYTGSPNRKILIEDNYFMCGSNAMELKGIADAIVRNNTFWAPHGMVMVQMASREALQKEAAQQDVLEAKPAKAANGPGGRTDEKVTELEGEPAQKEPPAVLEPRVVFENNRYLDNGKFDLAGFRQAVASGKTDSVVPGQNGRPSGLHVFKRVNHYEPERVHMAVYNWDGKDSVRVDLEGILRPGETYRVVNVLDYFGEPVAQGTAQGPFIDLPMKGHRYEPEFGAYVLFRSTRKDRAGGTGK